MGESTERVDGVDSGGGRHFKTSDVASLLEIVARVQREHLHSEGAEEPGGGDPLPSQLTGDQLDEWFSKERYIYAEEIAEGGMAKIYCAADLQLCRTVALKMLLTAQSRENTSRFVYEAQVAGQLQHPNVVPIYDAGIDPHTGLPFIVMQLISGRSVLDIILGLRRNNPETRRFASLSERLGIFLKACDAIEYAHTHQVIHRDIKPSNIMVGDHGEVYVIDWGIAESKGSLPPPDPVTGKLKFGTARVSTFHDVYKLSDPGSDPTFMGSPVHMAPEQIVDPRKVDERTDIYGLGCTLYELVTLRTPFDGGIPLDQLLSAKKKAAYLPVSQYVPGTRRGLTEIIDRCMAPSRSNRYASVHALQSAIKKYMHDALRQGGPAELDELEELVRGLTPGEFPRKTKSEILKRIRALKRHCDFEEAP